MGHLGRLAIPLWECAGKVNKEYNSNKNYKTSCEFKGS